MSFGLVSAAASVASGLIGANASKKAAKSQADAAQQASNAQLESQRGSNALQERMLDKQLGLSREQWKCARTDMIHSGVPVWLARIGQCSCLASTCRRKAAERRNSRSARG